MKINKKIRLKNIITGDVLPLFDIRSIQDVQKRKEYVDWISFDLVSLVEEFYAARAAHDKFVPLLDRCFSTKKSANLVKKYVIGYLYNLFLLFDYFCFETQEKQTIPLEDNPLNRFAAGAYMHKFNATRLDIFWGRRLNILERISVALFHAAKACYYSLKKGLIVLNKKKHFKVLRELKWGFSGINGAYFHDDFMVDGSIIKNKEFLAFIRGKPKDAYALSLYNSLKASNYENFDIEKLKINLQSFLFRIIPLYCLKGIGIILKCIQSANFSLYSSIFYRFLVIGILHEKVFANYTVSSQLGHQYYSYDHIIEAIICNNHRARYFLCQLSDNSIRENKLILPYLGADNIFSWGRAHDFVREGNENVYLHTGYVFKRFINEARLNKINMVRRMNLPHNKKNILFFDEDFGGVNRLSAEHYMYYWEAIFALWARLHTDVNIIVKPKDPFAYKCLPPAPQKRYLDMTKKMKASGTLFTLGFPEWSFIDLLGIADLVVTPGMTSSVMIALVCGIEGLYFDKAGFNHPLMGLKNKLVFDDQQKFVDAARKILESSYSVFNFIENNGLREFDQFEDDRSIDLVRHKLAGSEADFFKRSGINEMHNMRQCCQFAAGSNA